MHASRHEHHLTEPAARKAATITRADFDITSHHRQRTRRAEARAQALEQLNAQLYRMLADAATLTMPEHPTLFIRLLDEMAKRRRTGPSIDALVQLLRETEPVRRGA